MDRLQKQRFEMKYIIPPPLALAVRDFVSTYLELDEFGATRPDFSYPVHSLYVDSDDFALHQSTVNGDKNRIKLRIRFYENRPGAPVFFEIKRRMDNTISKDRGAVRREAVDALLAGHLPDASQMASEDPHHLVGVQKFIRHINQLQARPKVHVAYDREAWMPVDGGNSVRVTLDRRVRSCPETTAHLVADMTDPVHVFGDQVVLELKYTGRFPNWFGDLVRVFNLRQTSAAKYVDGVVLMEDRNILQPDGTFRLPSAVRKAKARRDRKVRPTPVSHVRYFAEGTA